MCRKFQGEVFVQSLTRPTDYPWSQLGCATIVDVGGGVGKPLVTFWSRGSVCVCVCLSVKERQSRSLFIEYSTDCRTSLLQKADSLSSYLTSTPRSNSSSKTGVPSSAWPRMKSSLKKITSPCLKSASSSCSTISSSQTLSTAPRSIGFDLSCEYEQRAMKVVAGARTHERNLLPLLPLLLLLLLSSSSSFVFKSSPTDLRSISFFSHDWSDKCCIQILSNLASAMSTKTSRILICDQLMISTLPSPDPVIPSAPSPLAANYGVGVRYSHQLDLLMMGIINGIERTPDQLKAVVEKSGLRIHKVWECRSQMPIVELRLAAREESQGGEQTVTRTS